MSESEKIPLKSDERIEDDYDAESVCSKAGSTSTQEVTWDEPKFRHEERRRSAKNNLMTALNVFCLVLSSILFASSFISGDEAQNWAYRQVSYDSPMFDRYEIETESKIVAGTLFNEDSLTEQEVLLRTYPNAKVDAAWDALTDVGIVTISTEEVKRLGKDPSKTVRAPSDWGFGSDAHLAQIDGQHALHCLNAVRRYAYRERYYPYVNETRVHGGQSPLRPFDQAHLSHCLHILLQSLSCNPSMDMITHNWVDTQLYPFPDFSINKKCMKHEQLLRWQAETRLSGEQWKEMSLRGPTPGETVLPMPQRLREWSEDEDSVSADV